LISDEKLAKQKTFLLFYFLTAYALLQFAWWSYLLFELNNEIYRQKTELILYKHQDANEVMKEGNELNSKLHKRWLMIVGEGSIFLVLMVLGILQIRNTRKKEITLANQQKNFLLSVTHELKSPIASAKLQLQTLQKRELPKEKQQEIIASAIADTERLNNLAENILLAARIDNDAFSLHTESANISELIKETIKSHSLSVTQKTFFNIQEEIFLNIDKISFPSIALNLYENAVKYSPADSTITVTLKRENSKIIFAIADEGPGIPDQEKSLVFNKFYRIGNEETRSAKGTGLGLYIVKHIVGQHKGVIAVKNNSPKGSIFEVSFIV
jgi:two-component system phosphate regulon sensor histidine kinase PhoR